MCYLGKVKNGVVVLDGEVTLADGTIVRVEPVEPEQSSSTSLGERLMRVAGKAVGLPADLARNHDHYLHGRPRK